ncbi:MAG: Gfo/Idh/MocA family oxidoreductase [Chloroflexia bacterium]
MKTFGVGIVGAGVIGNLHARALKEVERARLVATAEPREGAGRQLADEYGADWHPDLAELLDRDDVDVVILGTPSGMHADHAVQAAQAGKHVISEKPMAVTREGADRMIAASRDAGVHLAVIFQNRYTRDAIRLKRAADAGLFGKLVLGNALVHWHRAQEYYDANGGWRGTWELDGGGALINQSIHTIDLLQWVMGPVESLAAYTTTLNHDIEAEDTASVALRFRAAHSVRFRGRPRPMRSSHRLEIRGTRARRRWRAHADRLEPHERRGSSHEEDLRVVEHGGDTYGDTHPRQLRLIFEALAEDRQPPVSGEEARKALEILRGIYRSANTGERVVFPAPALSTAAR